VLHGRHYSHQFRCFPPLRCAQVCLCCSSSCSCVRHVPLFLFSHLPQRSVHLMCCCIYFVLVASINASTTAPRVHIPPSLRVIRHRSALVPRLHLLQYLLRVWHVLLSHRLSHLYRIYFYVCIPHLDVPLYPALHDALRLIRAPSATCIYISWIICCATAHFRSL
jgi:hypothetical protein